MTALEQAIKDLQDEVQRLREDQRLMNLALQVCLTTLAEIKERKK